MIKIPLQPACRSGVRGHGRLVRVNTASGRFEEHWLCKADDGESALDLDAVRPAVAEVVSLNDFGRYLSIATSSDVLRASIERLPFLINQTKAGVADAKFVELAVGPAHRRLRDLFAAG